MRKSITFNIIELLPSRVIAIESYRHREEEDQRVIEKDHRVIVIEKSKTIELSSNSESERNAIGTHLLNLLIKKLGLVHVLELFNRITILEHPFHFHRTPRWLIF